MKYAIRKTLLLLVISASLSNLASANESFINILRNSALQNGFLPAKQTYVDTDQNLSKVGKVFFESKNVSLNDDISCRTCHLDEFGAGDGLPNAIGVLGHDEGPKRAFSDGKIVPRNAMPLWGRGGKGFNVFFWDGKVDFSNGNQISQFGKALPTRDPLIVAAHLPALEIREMLNEDTVVEEFKSEKVLAAEALQKKIVENLQTKEQEGISELAHLLGKTVNELEFLDVARSIAAFIRNDFKLQNTKFHQFVFGSASLSKAELRGGMIFYGKGKCANCHSGPYLSDFTFHAIAFPQLGFGKNGFGVDYGRYNVTLSPGDLYKFKTPSLINAEKTAPYGHSGSLATLTDAITAHFDPLKFVDISKMSSLDRHEMFKRIALTDGGPAETSYLDNDEVSDLVTFLKTLSF